MPSVRPVRLLLVAAALALVTAGCGDPETPPAAAPQFASAPVSAGEPSAAVPPSSAPPAAPSSAGPVAIPAGVTAGIVIYDRQARTYVLQQKASWRFRSASLVKLL